MAIPYPYYDIIWLRRFWYCSTGQSTELALNQKQIRPHCLCIKVHMAMYPHACGCMPCAYGCSSMCPWKCIQEVMYKHAHGYVSTCKIWFMQYRPQRRNWFGPMDHSAEFCHVLWATMQNHRPQHRITNFI
jgi:hypothetical protein